MDFKLNFLLKNVSESIILQLFRIAKVIDNQMLKFANIVGNSTLYL
jgi:hypothetical protein